VFKKRISVELLEDDSVTVAELKESGKISEYDHETIPWRFGGVRYYLICKHCSQRRYRLYLIRERKGICRECLNLTYRSSNYSSTNTIAYMDNQLRKEFEKIGCEYKPKYGSQALLFFLAPNSTAIDGGFFFCLFP
jgi:hypothetical protein